MVGAFLGTSAEVFVPPSMRDYKEKRKNYAMNVIFENNVQPSKQSTKSLVQFKVSY